jgi:hypothetical protein
MGLIRRKKEQSPKIRQSEDPDAAESTETGNLEGIFARKI